MSKDKVEYGKNIMLVSSFWGETDTFKLMPVTDECPYTEVIYNPAVTILVVIGKLKKNNFQMIDKLNDDGEPTKKKFAEAGKDPFRKQRMNLEMFQEYYITDPKEQEDFIKAFAVNADSFDRTKYIRDVNKESTGVVQIEKPAILAPNGAKATE